MLSSPDHSVWRRCFRIGAGVTLAAVLLGFPGGVPGLAQEKPQEEEGPGSREAAVEGERAVAIVVGVAGEASYGETFRSIAESWRAGAERGGARWQAFGLDEERKEVPDRESLKEWLREERERSADTSELWLVLIGHGSFDGRRAKFNLRGPDVSEEEMAEWLQDWPGRLVVINGTSSSAPFLTSLSDAGRVVISATKSAQEIYYARFQEHFARAIAGEPEGDLDNDEQVSLLEAFLYAAQEVEAFFEAEGRLATEHALLDDNGDGLGTRSEWFEGVRAVRLAKQGAEPDGLLAHQQVLVPSEAEALMPLAIRQRRDELEQSVTDLRSKREALGEEAYYQQLEGLLLELARLYREYEPPEKPSGPSSEAEGDAPADNPGGEEVKSKGDRT